MSSPFDFKYMIIYTPPGGCMNKLEYRFSQYCISGQNFGYIENIFEMKAEISLSYSQSKKQAVSLGYLHWRNYDLVM